MSLAPPLGGRRATRSPAHALPRSRGPLGPLGPREPLAPRAPTAADQAGPGARRGAGLRRLLALISALVLIPALATSTIGRDAWVRLGLMSAGAPLTELSLDQHGDLTGLVTPSGSVRLSFTAHNASAGPHSYHWVVTSTTGTQASRRYGAGDLRLAAGGRADVAVRGEIADCALRTRVVVSLTSDGAAGSEQVSFWVEPGSEPLVDRTGRPTCGG